MIYLVKKECVFIWAFYEYNDIIFFLNCHLHQYLLVQSNLFGTAEPCKISTIASLDHCRSLSKPHQHLRMLRAILRSLEVSSGKLENFRGDLCNNRYLNKRDIQREIYDSNVDKIRLCI